MKALIIKSLLSSPPEADQREGVNPSLTKRGAGRFFDNNALLIHSLVSGDNTRSSANPEFPSPSLN